MNMDYIGNISNDDGMNVMSCTLGDSVCFTLCLGTCRGFCTGNILIPKGDDG
jgi:hypothetical protein